MESDKIQQRIEFLKSVAPFNIFKEDVLGDIALLLTEKFYSGEELIYRQDDTELFGIDIIVEGGYDAFYYDRNGNLKLDEHYTRGFVYGGGSVLLNKKVSVRTVITKENTRILFLSKDEFRSLCKANNRFFQHFVNLFSQKMLNVDYAQAIGKNISREGNFIDADKIYTRKLSSFESRELIMCSADTSVTKAAMLMKVRKVPCLYIKDKEQITGFVTHKILVEKVMALGADLNSPVGLYADKHVLKLSGDIPVFEAILAMFRLKIDYVIVETGAHLGLMGRHRLLSEHAQSPLLYIQSVKLAKTVEELRLKWQQVPDIVNQMLERGVNPQIVNQLVTTISDTILSRVIEGVLEEKDEPPAKFVFMVLGSEGRREQTLVTDQDNAIIYEDKANEQRELVREYFLNFATEVSFRLDYIGFSYCKGGYMAQNPKWTHSLSHWKENYNTWIKESIPETVIKVSTFFDCRFVHGEKRLIDELALHVNQLLENAHSKFYYFLASNTLLYEPPLTLFNNFRTTAKDDKKVIDIKRVMTPIVDLARMYSLRKNVNKTNTGDRLKALHDLEVFNDDDYREIYNAYYYLMGLRLKHQAKYVLEDFAIPSNYIEPGLLTRVEQITLKEILKFIKNIQTRLKMEFGMNI